MPVTSNSSHSEKPAPGKPKIVANPWIRIVLLFFGWLFVFFAFIGAILPLIPTTPFLLVAAACFYRSSEKFHGWIMNNRLFGHYLQDYKAGKGIPLHVKAIALLFTWTSTMISVLFFIPFLWLKILVTAISVAVTIHLAVIKTRR